MGFVIGVDGGASKTLAALADSSGHALAIGRGGGSNHQVGGMASAMAEIGKAVGAALEQARLAPDHLDAACFCLAGADLPEDFAALEAGLARLGLSRSILLKNDTMAALRAGLSRSWGVVVICGTGFNAAGRSPDGREVRLPGLGFISGDWGGGSRLSQEIIRAVMRAWDGRGPSTRLTQVVLEALKASSEEELLARLYHNMIDGSRLLDLVPLLFRTAAAGDAVATSLIAQMGTEVGTAARAMLRRLSIGVDEAAEVVLGGSVFKGEGPLLLDTVNLVLRSEFPRATLVRLKHEPVFGAVLFALEAGGLEVSPQVYANLAGSIDR